MNTSILQDKTTCEDLKNHINIFLETNKDSTKQIYVWRRVLIQKSVILRKLDQGNTHKYEEEIKRLEKQFWTKPTDACLSDLLRAKYELNKIFSKKADYSLFRLKQKWYKSGDKPGKLLANQLKTREASYQIAGVKNKKGRLVTSQPNL